MIEQTILKKIHRSETRVVYRKPLKCLKIPEGLPRQVTPMIFMFLVKNWNLQTVVVDYLAIYPYLIVSTFWKTKGIRCLI